MARKKSTPNSENQRPAKYLQTGIYEIVNTISGKQYVGSAVHFANRWRGHKRQLACGEHHSRHLQRAWDKYGAESFQFRPLLFCAKEDLICFEQRAIDALVPEYNVSQRAGSTLGVKFTDEARAKIAAKAVGRIRSSDSIERGAAKLRGKPLPPERVAHLIGNQFALGIKHTEERKAIISAQHMGRKRPKDAEYRAKISAALKGRKQSLEQRAAASARLKGKPRGPYKPRSPEAIAKTVAARKQVPNPMLGKTHSAETRAKISEALRGKTLSAEKTAKIKVNIQAMWDAQKKAGVTGRLAKKQNVYQEIIEQT